MNYGQLFEQNIMETSPKALLPLRDGVTQMGSAFAKLTVRRDEPQKSTQRSVACTLYNILRTRSAICKNAYAMHMLLLIFGQAIK